MQKNIEVCLSPHLLDLFDFSNKIVVVVDIFRATTSIVSALAFGAKKVRAVSSVEEALSLKSHNFLIAGERGGMKVEGFDLGNSPIDFRTDAVNGKSIVITTTNGTLCINKTHYAKEQILGSFINISSTVEYLIKQKEDILILCAGWKGTVNLEDTFYAGALVSALKDQFSVESDSCKLAFSLYNLNKENAFDLLKNADHAIRLKRIGYERDIEFCLRKDLHHLVAVIRNGEIVAID